jgi:hypothetical protein
MSLPAVLSKMPKLKTFSGDTNKAGFDLGATLTLLFRCWFLTLFLNFFFSPLLFYPSSDENVSLSSVYIPLCFTHLQGRCGGMDQRHVYLYIILPVIAGSISIIQLS